MIEDIIAAALVADGAPEAHAQSLALRIKSDLAEAGALVAEPEPYVPKPYPKWVHGKVVRSAAEEAARAAKFAPPATGPAVVVEVTKPTPAEPAAPAASMESIETAEPPVLHVEPTAQAAHEAEPVETKTEPPHTGA